MCVNKRMRNSHSKSLFLSALLIALFRVGLQNPSKKYYIPNIKVNWHKANEFCNSIGMQLVAIQSQEKNDAVAAFVKSTDKFDNDVCVFWIGGTDLAEEGVFSWTATGKLVTYENWSLGEPNNTNGTEDCMQLVYIPKFKQYWSWNDNNCKTHRYYFICENNELECISQF
ncbi:C-type lectin 37Da-like [Sabethes cyaneus]|uniref:C-type lectin 37Da-like n=1 Tax=Sabethes cyaneus TaxID=53552 RepID=UPI00237E6578|nr:C-type lectin 37Da-like [Sabethes cyaneus]